MRKYDVNRKRSGITGIERYLANPETIIGIDGEGVTRRGIHYYILLAARDGNGNHATVKNADQLSTKDCLNFLCNLPDKSIKLAFSFGYDVNMILKDLGWEKLQKLHQGEYITWGTFRLKYIPRKYFYVGNVIKPKLRCTIYDTFGYFQTSFVKALRAWNVEGDTTSIDAIEAMKEKRGKFDVSMLEEIESYCLDECLLLVKMMQKVFISLQQAKIYPSQYNGPGPLAGYVLNKNNIRTFMSSESDWEKSDMPRYGYYGGRFDVTKVGYFKESWVWDINSAYPHACTFLPCLAHGRFVPVKEYDPKLLHTLWLINWKLHPLTPWLPFPWRNPKGEIYYPRYGRGWYWDHEIAAGIKLIEGYGGAYEIERGYTLQRECDHKPFEWLPAFYDLRRQYQAEGNPAERVMKLATNSFYGKLAQTVGFKDGKPPPFRCLTWAGMITSFTRAMLLLKTTYNPDAIIMHATDGLISTKPLKSDSDVGDGLGQWKVERGGSLWLIQPGIYWFPEKEAKGSVKTRGHNPLEIDWDDIIRAWAQDPFDGVYTYTTTRFVGMGLALQQVDYAHQWRTWQELENTIHFTPRRREINTSKKDYERNGTIDWVAQWDKGAGLSRPYMGETDNSYPGLELMKLIEKDQA